MWSYDPANLSKNTPEGRKNIVRLIVGDTEEVDPQVQDEEILFALDANNDKIYSSALFVVGAIYSKYARLVNTELDEAIREDYSDLLDNYKKLKDNIENRAKFENGAIRIVATGLTKQNFEDAALDPNRVRPGIEQYKWRDCHDIPSYGHFITT